MKRLVSVGSAGAALKSVISPNDRLVDRLTPPAALITVHTGLGQTGHAPGRVVGRIAHPTLAWSFQGLDKPIFLNNFRPKFSFKIVHLNNVQ